MKTKKSTIFTVLIAIFMFTGSCFAEGKATPEDVYNKVLEGVAVLEGLGEEGLAAFSDPKGDFVYKDTYVVVQDCEKGTTAIHPIMPQLNGTPVTAPKCKKTGVEFAATLCDVTKNPNGGWIEYWWMKKGESKDKFFRKVSFAVAVPNTPYVITSGIYNETISLDELNGSL